MLKGAELILAPNACYLDPIRNAQIMVRALENQVGFALTNYPAPYYNGMSVAYDHNGNQLVMAQSDETIAYADFNVTAIREHR